MSRFVRTYHHAKDDPGSRLRIDYDPDDTGAFEVCDENVLPEKVDDQNCNRVNAIANVSLDRASARWMRDAFIDLCEHLDEEDRLHGEARRAAEAADATREVRTTLDAVERCPHGNMPREAGAGHWREWHRGHGCHLDPDTTTKKGDIMSRRYQHTHDEARIRAALGSMPYGGGIQSLRDASSRVGFRDGFPAPVELGDVATYLETMVVRLDEIAKESSANLDELRGLRADIAAVRRVFGAEP